MTSDAADEAVGEAAVDRQRVPGRIAEEDVDVRHVRAEDQRGKALARGGLQTGLAQHPAGHRVGQIVQAALADQSLCGSFSTCQVWPLETSAWRSAFLPDAAAAFCSITADSKVGAGSS